MVVPPGTLKSTETRVLVGTERRRYSHEKHTAGVESFRCIDARPDDWDEIHGLSNSPDAIVHIAIRSTEVKRRDTSNILEDLLRPAEFGDDTLRRNSGQRWVTPCMDSKLVAGHVLYLHERRVGDCARADNEECGVQVLLIEILQQFGGVETGAIIISQTPSQLIRTICYISLSDTTTTSPPAGTRLRRVSSRRRVSLATTRQVDRNIRDNNARLLNFLDPLLDLGGVGRRRPIKRRIVGRGECGNYGKMSAGTAWRAWKMTRQRTVG